MQASDAQMSTKPAVESSSGSPILVVASGSDGSTNKPGTIAVNSGESTTPANVTATKASVTTSTSTPVAKTPSTKKRNLSAELQNDQKRRSSSRSIKRKRFDDEIVEYSIGFPQSRGDQHHRVGRPRTTSQPYAASSSLPPPASGSPHAPPSSVGSAGMLTMSTGIEPKGFSSSTTAVSEGKSASPKLQTAASLTAASKSANSSISGGAAGGGKNSGMTSMTAPLTASSAEKRRTGPRAHGRRARRAGRPPAQVATKNLGRWKPIDDLALITGILQTNDLRMVHRGVKFSCKFSVQEIQTRWTSLLYEPVISRTAMAAIRNLHPELVETVKRRTLFSVEEEEILSTIKSTDNPKLEKFQELIDQNAAVFYSSRTPKVLQKHWQLMKRFQLLPDQTTKTTPTTDFPLSFSDAEDHMLDTELNEQRDETLEIEFALADRKKKREIRLIENELGRWNVLVDSITSSGIAPEFDGQTLAVLRGRSVRYLMRSKEITFGRPANDSVVDVDLSLEGPAAKISRRQGTIKLRSNGDFFVANEGKRPIFIDGTPLMSGSKTRLTNNCVVEICSLRFVFLVNYELINAIRRESAKTTGPLN